MTRFSFPGFGIGETEVNPVAVAFSLFGKDFEIRWYAICICTGMLLAVLYVMLRARKAGIDIEHVIDIALFIIPIGIVGARLYYVIWKFEDYLFTGGVWYENILYTLKNIVSVWEGGLAIYGGIIAGAITLHFVARYKKLNTMTMLDMISPAAMIGQILGRWGNFFNGEAYGSIVGESNPLYFIRMGLSSKNTLMDFGTRDMVYVHPTFLYESLWNLCGFVIANVIYKKKKFEGEVFCFYIAWYGFGRMFIEGLRTDSLKLGPWKVSQLLGFACFIVGTLLLVIFLRRVKSAKETESIAYEGVYASLRKKTRAEADEKTAEEEALEDEMLDKIIKKNPDGGDSAEEPAKEGSNSEEE